jgi:uncharacterized protein (UPF0332 family)
MAGSVYQLGTPEDHRARGERNLKLAEQLDSIMRYDWAVTVRFYSALHYAHARLSQAGAKRVESHGGRDAMIAVDSELKKCYTEYSELFERSRDARYSVSVVMTERDSQTAKNQLENIRRVVESSLGV